MSAVKQDALTTLLLCEKESFDVLLSVFLKFELSLTTGDYDDPQGVLKQVENLLGANVDASASES